MSSNLVQGGDFEDTSYLKTQASPDGVLTHRFSQQYDLGKWLAKWGPPTQDGGYGGFSSYNNPRNLAETGGDGTQQASNLGTMNRSVDPLNSSNHILEGTMFRPRWGQWIQAPENHVAGPIQFNFDFMQSDWNASLGWGWVYVYGLNFLPENDVSYCTDSQPGCALTPLGAVDEATQMDGDLLIKFQYDRWMSESIPNYFDTWHQVSTSDATGAGTLWGQVGIGANTNILTTTLTQTYQYYAVIGQVLVYDEGHPYFWLNAGKISDTFSQGFDNISLKLSVQGPSFLPGDFNGDGTITLSDINPFKLALTDTAAWQAQFPSVVLTEVDPNGDGVITLSDINPFKAILTGGSNAAIPEPATLSLLALGALVLVRRR
ncbi:MAG: PEP-CTERM sorting domain-containing protein [Phycisphaeraceae bacterium]|nr:PEP-CTERM sorting domain-containing protein [Phycisphaeraceae bacterium]